MVKSETCVSDDHEGIQERNKNSENSKIRKTTATTEGIIDLWVYLYEDRREERLLVPIAL